MEDLDDAEKDVVADLRTCKFDIDKDYEYVKKGFIFKLFSNILYYGIALPILTILLKIVYNYKIEGKENIKNLNGGAVSISNHVLILDCALLGLTFRSKKIYYTTQEESFKIPFVRKLIKLLRAIPIPKKIDNMKRFLIEIGNLLKEGSIVQMYPEAVLHPYCKEIRKFKNGAFDIASKNNVPIIPCVFTYRKPKGIRKMFKKKPDITIKILKPIEVKFNNKEELSDIKEKIRTLMQENM